MILGEGVVGTLGDQLKAELEIRGTITGEIRVPMLVSIRMFICARLGIRIR